jgi:hypothetical protein
LQSLPDAAAEQFLLAFAAAVQADQTYVTTKTIKKVILDPSVLMADVNRGNNIYEIK